MTRPPRIALVHDRLNVRGGGEQVLEELAAIYPDAPIYTLIYDPKQFVGSTIAQHKIRTSYINKLPLSSHHRYYIPLMPAAMEAFDLSAYDVVISSSAAFAHGVRTSQHQLNISYIHSPMRYAWHQRKAHVEQLGFGAWPIRLLLSYLRWWDRKAASRPDQLIANSSWTALCIREAFKREATVIYPPVHVEKFRSAPQRKNYYVTVSRLVPYKRVDIIVSAFAQLGLLLKIVGDGTEYKALTRMAKPNIEFLGSLSDSEVAMILGEARAFVYAAEEDFGIAAVEAHAAGCPVIAYAHGGLLETVVKGKTGIFFDEQSVESLAAAVHEFETGNYKFETKVIKENAARFSADRFKREIAQFVEQSWEEFSTKS